MRYFLRHRATTAVAGVFVASAVVLTGCSDSAGPEAGAVTTDDLTQIEERLGTIDERLGTLEENVTAMEGEAGAAEGATVEGADAGAGQDIIGREVTVSAKVSEVVTTTDVGSAFRIAGQEGPSVAVLATTPPADLNVGDVVQITGTVQMVQRDSFEKDFGIGADELFEDADGFFTEAEGQPAIAAEKVEIRQETSK